jgi:hypothetical protein
VEIDDPERPGSKIEILEVGIPRERQREAEAWKLAKYISGGLFYAVYAFGVVDSVYHHRDQRVSTQVIERPRPAAPAAPVSSRQGRSPSGYLYPLAGGMGAGLTLSF